MRQVFRRLGVAGILVAVVALPGAAGAEQGPGGAKLRIIAIGAHPDDCDLRAGGTAARWAALGHQVKFLSVTSGDAGGSGGDRIASVLEREHRDLKSTPSFPSIFSLGTRTSCSEK